jgi:hypothetical protein
MGSPVMPRWYTFESVVRIELSTFNMLFGPFATIISHAPFGSDSGLTAPEAEL